MKFKQLAIIVILLVIGVLTYFALKPQGSEIKKENNTDLANASTTTNGEGYRQSENNTTNKWNTSGFNYIKEKLENGTLHGVVEVGASGFNSFVINMDKQKHWEIVSKDFGRSLVYEGLATTEDIRAGLTKYRAAMSAKGVNENNMHFVISSGAQKEPKTTIIIKELRSLGYVVNPVTVEQEAKYALKATVPTVYYDNSFMVDLGSGNTKI